MSAQGIRRNESLGTEISEAERAYARGSEPGVVNNSLDAIAKVNPMRLLGAAGIGIVAGGEALKMVGVPGIPDLNLWNTFTHDLPTHFQHAVKADVGLGGVLGSVAGDVVIGAGETITALFMGKIAWDAGKNFLTRTLDKSNQNLAEGVSS